MIRTILLIASICLNLFLFQVISHLSAGYHPECTGRHVEASVHHMAATRTPRI